VNSGISFYIWHTGDDDDVDNEANTDNDNEDDDDDDDDEGWITPSNIEAMKQATIAVTQSQMEELAVACVTTDYAMQVTFFSVTCRLS